jgi:hypothetical protein
MFVAFVYADYSKEVEIEILFSFHKKEDAVKWAEAWIAAAKRKAETSEFFEEDEEREKETSEYVIAHNVVWDKYAYQYKCFFGPRLAISEVPNQ